VGRPRYYDRCITRGFRVDDAAIYGNRTRFTRDLDTVAIRYEMVNETRVIPLDGRPHLGESIRKYLGDARGRWDGNTLVVETTNFNDKTSYRARVSI